MSEIVFKQMPTKPQNQKVSTVNFSNTTKSSYQHQSKCTIIFHLIQMIKHIIIYLGHGVKLSPIFNNMAPSPVYNIR